MIADSFILDYLNDGRTLLGFGMGVAFMLLVMLVASAWITRQDAPPSRPMPPEYVGGRPRPFVRVVDPESGIDTLICDRRRSGPAATDLPRSGIRVDDSQRITGHRASTRGGSGFGGT